MRLRPMLALILVTALSWAFALSVHAESINLPIVLNGEATTPLPTNTVVDATVTNTPINTPTPTNTSPAPTATNTPTNTPTNTVVSEPTATNTPTSTPVASVQVLNNWSYYVPVSGGLDVVGEVHNTGQVNVAFVNVTVGLLGTQGQILATASSYASERVIPPGFTACFWIHFNSPPPPDMVETFGFNTAYLVGGSIIPGLTILDMDGQYVPTGYQITGLVRNDGATLVDDVWVNATIYSSTGQVLRCHPDLNSPVDLLPGAVHTFYIPAPGLYSGVSTYRAVAQSVAP